MHPRNLVFALLAASTLAAAGDALAVCDPPLLVSHSGGRAKVLIILDNSGSMNEAVQAAGYNSAVTYPGNFSSTTTYNVTSDASRTPHDFNTAWPSTPSAYLVNSDQGESGQYPGNYLNWIYFTATATERAAIPAVTRIQTAKQAVNTVLANGSGSDYGVMIFNGDNGGTLLSAIGTATATIQSQVNGIRASTYTPLGETMVSALDYFKRTDAGAPLSGPCEKPFIIVITDGFPTKDLNVPAYLQDYDGDGQDPGTCTSMGAPYADNMDCSGYMDDVATYLYQNDLRTDISGMQNAVTYVIGFDLYAPILQSTATKGGGSYFSVDNPAGLADALNQTLSLIAAQMSASAPVSVVSSEDRTNNMLFRARFESQTWKGFVESFALPYQPNASPLWEAGSLLQSRSADSRTIFTSTSGTNKVDLVAANAASLMSPLAAVDVTEATQIIQFTRGNNVTGMRDRGGWKLGDVVDAAPVMVGKPTQFNPYLGYSSFRTANAGRREVLYVAANDGMLHCFDAANGAELWGYVPKNLLPRLRNLMPTSYCHEYFVNLTPSVFDMYLNGAWKTVLVGGEERGGSGLFALDVTDPAAAGVNVLWDVNLTALKGSWNNPTLVRDVTRNGHVLAIGTGYDATATQASLLELNPLDGSVIASFPLGSVVAGNKTTRAASIDVDLDGFDDRMYLGDLAGRMWRVDLTTNPWTVSLLFDCGQPIQAQPVLTLDALGRVMVFFGTGRYMTDSDLTSTSTQSFYGIVDDNSGIAATFANLVDQTSSWSAVTSGKRGWFLNLVEASGERITRRAVLVAGTIYVPSFRPNPGACQGGGDSWLYSLDYKDGSAPNNPTGSENNVTAGRVQSQGSGIIADPAVDLVNEVLVLQSSTPSLTTRGFNAGLKKLVVRSWRQKWN